MTMKLTLSTLAREAKQAQSNDTGHRGEEFRTWLSENAGDVAALLGLSASELETVLSLDTADCDRPLRFQDANIGRSFGLAVVRIREILKRADEEALTLVRSNLAADVAASYDRTTDEVDAVALRELVRGTFEADRVAFDLGMGDEYAASAGRLREILTLRDDARVYLRRDRVEIEWGARGRMRLAAKLPSRGSRRSSSGPIATVAVAR